MQVPEAKPVPRFERVQLPVLVSFSTDVFCLREFTLNLSEGGIFLPTGKTYPPGTRGTLKFRTSQFDEPFSVAAEVAWTRGSDQDEPDSPAGMGMRFIDPGERERGLLRRLVEGTSSGSIVQAIRSGLKDSGRSLDQELRQRSTDQKLILARHANGEEIGALLRDGNPSVLIRLLECPHMTTAHVVRMMNSPNLPTRVLSAIRKHRQWNTNAEVRWLFCLHNNAILSEVIGMMRLLSPEKLRRLAGAMRVRPQIRAKAQDMTRSKDPFRRR